MRISVLKTQDNVGSAVRERFKVFGSAEAQRSPLLVNQGKIHRMGRFRCALENRRIGCSA